MLKWTVALGLVMALGCAGETPFMPIDWEQTPQDPVQENAADAPPSPAPTPAPSGGTGSPANVTPDIARICAQVARQDPPPAGWGEAGDTPEETEVLCQKRMMDMRTGLESIRPGISEGPFEVLASCLEASPVEDWPLCQAGFSEQTSQQVNNLSPLEGLSDEEVAGLQGAEVVRNYCVALFNRTATLGLNNQLFGSVEQCVTSLDAVYQMGKSMGHNADEGLTAATRCMEEAEDLTQLQHCQQQASQSLQPNL